MKKHFNQIDKAAVYEASNSSVYQEVTYFVWGPLRDTLIGLVTSTLIGDVVRKSRNQIADLECDSLWNPVGSILHENKF